MTKPSLDISGPLAKLDWAADQIPSLEIKVRDLVEAHTERTPGKVLIHPINVPRSIAVAAGAIIHAQRSSLDLLISAASLRNGAPANRQPHFPIRRSQVDFASDPRVRENMRDLTDREKAIVVGLKPYFGGNSTLSTLHQLDILDKHRRLIVTVRRINDIEIQGNGFIRAMEWGGSGEDTFLLLDADPGIYVVPKVQIAISLDDGTFISLISALNDFGALARNIIELFDVEAEREAREGS